MAIFVLVVLFGISADLELHLLLEEVVAHTQGGHLCQRLKVTVINSGIQGQRQLEAVCQAITASWRAATPCEVPLYMLLHEYLWQYFC